MSMFNPMTFHVFTNRFCPQAISPVRGLDDHPSNPNPNPYHF